MRKWIVLGCFLVVFPFPAFGASTEQVMQNIFAEGITVDLRNPTYENGVLKTTEGGVVTGPNIRIQALKITYIRKPINEKEVFKISAEGQLMLEYGEYLFVGECLEYDFQTRCGMIYNARSALEPWYFGGTAIELLPDGSYRIHNGYITTSENSQPEWRICANKTDIIDDRFMRARNVKFCFTQLPLLWLPFLKMDLKTILDSPIKYHVHWGGRQGPRFGFSYEIASWRSLKAYLRLDYRLRRGLGGGIETDYKSPDCKELFYTRNYLADDTSIIDPRERLRYRFQGAYRKIFPNEKLSMYLTYDKLSDKEMPTDYHNAGIKLETGERTQFHLRYQEHCWITNFCTRVRINPFQTVKQELPTFLTTFHPKTLGHSGIIFENLFKAGYLDFRYPNELPNVTDYNSPRLEFRHRIYRPCCLGPFTGTPEAELVTIFYGNSPSQDVQMLALGRFGYEVNTQLQRTYGPCKHVISPYIRYQYDTCPTVSPLNHYIFDIQDGWAQLNTLRFGFRNLVYVKSAGCCPRRYLSADLYANAFFDTPTIPSTIPKVYAKIICDTLPTLRHTLATAWDFDKNFLDHINFLSEWTVNSNLAIATEYRHRSDFAWRKVDHTNLILESFRNEPALRASRLSDKRDTFLLHLFYKFGYSWAIEAHTRYGWNRRNEPHYTEYQIDLLKTIRSAWHFKASYQHREGDHRIAFYISMGVKRPTYDTITTCQQNILCD